MDLLVNRALAAFGLVSFGWIICCTAWAGSIQGTATYRERVALPPGAVFEAELQDISRADVPAVVLGRARLEPVGQPPFTFEITYGDASIQQGRHYTIRATVKHQGQLLFTTDRIYPVLDGHDGPLRLLLVSARGGSKSGPGMEGIGSLPATFEGELPGAGGPIVWHVDLLLSGRYQLRMTYVGKPEPNHFDDIGRWTRESDSGRIVLRGGREETVFLMPVDGGAALRKLDLHGKPITSGHNDRLLRQSQASSIEPRLMITGMFTYMADAASITLCADGQRLPIAMEGNYKALETAYLQARLQPGQAVLVSMEGLIAQRPSTEENHPPRRTLVVERFIAVWPRETCGNVLADSPLRGTYWTLVRLYGSPVPAATKQREARLILATHESRVSGSGGCNRVRGSFKLDGDRLSFDHMASTMMACPEGRDEEKKFMEALEKVERYRIRGSHLELLDAAGAVSARFEAAPLR